MRHPALHILSTYMGGRYAYMSGNFHGNTAYGWFIIVEWEKTSSHPATAKNDPDGTPDPIAHH